MTIARLKYLAPESVIKTLGLNEFTDWNKTYFETPGDLDELVEVIQKEYQNTEGIQYSNGLDHVLHFYKFTMISAGILSIDEFDELEASKNFKYIHPKLYHWFQVCSWG